MKHLSAAIQRNCCIAKHHVGRTHPTSLRSRSVTTRAEVDRNEGTTKTTKGKQKQIVTKATSANAPVVNTSPPPKEFSLLDVPFITKTIRSLGLHRMDTALLLGDALVVLVTHVASEEIPYCELSNLALVSMACWVCAASLKGDYAWGKRYQEDGALEMQPGYSIFVGIREAAFTWLLFVPLVLSADASLMMHNVLGAHPLMDVAPGAKVSSELEIIVALSLTQPCWRGLYYMLRDGVY